MHGQETEVDGSELLWHNGMVGGSASFLGIVPSHELGVIVLTNTAKSVDAVGIEILEALVELEKRQSQALRFGRMFTACNSQVVALFAFGIWIIGSQRFAKVPNLETGACLVAELVKSSFCCAPEVLTTSATREPSFAKKH